MLPAFLLAIGMLWILEKKIKRIKLEVQLESNLQPLGWESDMLTTVPPV